MSSYNTGEDPVEMVEHVLQYICIRSPFLSLVGHERSINGERRC